MSSQNNFKHGLYSKQLVLPCESAAGLDALKFDLRTEHQPANTTEEILVNEMAEHCWRIKRARLFESKILNTSLDIPALNAAHRLMSSAERGFHKALKTLRELQKQRGFVGGGFESQIEQPTQDQQLIGAGSVATRGLETNAGFESQIHPSEATAHSQSTAEICPAVSGGFESQTADNKSRDTAAIFAKLINDPKTDPTRRAIMEEFLRDKAKCDSLKAELNLSSGPLGRAA
jgi:hypothetical protein